jgi:hypothetical protein
MKTRWGWIIYSRNKPFILNSDRRSVDIPKFRLRATYSRLGLLISFPPHSRTSRTTCLTFRLMQRGAISSRVREEIVLRTFNSSTGSMQRRCTQHLVSFRPALQYNPRLPNSQTTSRPFEVMDFSSPRHRTPRRTANCLSCVLLNCCVLILLKLTLNSSRNLSLISRISTFEPTMVGQAA